MEKMEPWEIEWEEETKRDVLPILEEIKKGPRRYVSGEIMTDESLERKFKKQKQAGHANPSDT